MIRFQGQDDQTSWHSRRHRYADGGQRLSLGLLGKVTLWGEHGDVPLTHKQAQVLALLAAARNTTVSLDYLAEAIWVGHPPRCYRNIIHGYIRDLRRKIEDEVGLGVEIGTEGAYYSLCIAPERVDADVFDELVEQATKLFADGQSVESAQLLGWAERLWRGPALLDTRLIDLAGTVAAFEEQRMLASELHVDILTQIGHHREALVVLRPLLHEFPRHENFHMQAMYAMHLAGRRAESLTMYHEFRGCIIRELGIEPGLAFKRLQQVILADKVHSLTPLSGQPSLLVDRLVGLAPLPAK